MRNQRNKQQGLLVSFEGPEGSGKSSHIKVLAKFLREQSYRVVTTREPGGTTLGKVMRRLLLNTACAIHPQAELLLFMVDRVQHLHEVIIPALKGGAVVITDRFFDSTFAYQVGGRKLAYAEVRKLNEWATGGMMPHLTFLLDVPPRVGLARAGKRAKRQGKSDRFEAASPRFHRAVREAFLLQAKKYPRRFVCLNTEAQFEIVQQQIETRVLSQLARHHG